MRAFLAVALVVALVAVVIAFLRAHVSAEWKRAREEAQQAHVLSLLQVFAPVAAAVAADPRAVLMWEPLARTARQIFPDEFAQLDRAADSAFPLSRERIQAAHDQWTADWLAWERSHDVEFKLKAVAAQDELARAEGSAVWRARLDAIESQKLDLYQRRYQDYVRTAKALQAFLS
jgi:hypothetical protein